MAPQSKISVTEEALSLDATVQLASDPKILSDDEARLRDTMSKLLEEEQLSMIIEKEDKLEATN